MIIRRYADLNRIATPGGNASAAVATPSHGATAISIVRQRVQPGGGNPPHTHDQEEAMTLLSGTVTLMVAGESVELAAGDTAIVPTNTPHQISNTGSEPAEWLLVAPGGVRFFHTSGEEAFPEWAK